MRASTASRLATLAVTILTIVLPGVASALDPARRVGDYVQDQWRIPDGLPQESITAILQTRDGYLWLGTLDGLVRFDGVRIETLNLIHDAGMETNVVLALAESAEGGVVVGTRTGIVHFLDGTFRREARFASLSDPYVRSLAVGPDGTLFVGTRFGGLNVVAGERVTTYSTREGLADPDVRAVDVDRLGHVWVATQGGLARLANGSLSQIKLGDSADANRIITVRRGQATTMWVGTNDGLWSIDTAGPGRPVGPVMQGFQVRAIVEDADGNVWAGTTSGFARVRGTQVELAPEPANMSQRHVRSLALDREQSLWVGTDGGGLRRYRDGAVVMRRSGLGGETDTLMAVHQDAAGVMWFGANCGGLIRWAESGARAFTRRDGLPDDCVRTLASNRDGTLWIGTLNGIARMKDGRIDAFSTADGFASVSVMALTVDRHGALWVGSGSGGLDRFVDGRVVNFSTATGLSSNDVRAVLESRDGGLWIGTFGGGLNYMKDGRVTVYGRDQGLKNSAVLALAEDPDGTLWIGTNGGGLARLRQGTITSYTTATGLFSDGIFSIVSDSLGHLWMGSNRGIFRVSRRDLDEVASGARPAVTSTTLSFADGLRTGGVWGGANAAGLRATDGRLWFPTVDGAAVVDPARLPRNTALPPVHVTRLVVDDRVIPMAGTVSLPAGSREIEIAYTAPSFVMPAKMQFQYRLEGFDPHWSDAGQRRSAFFTNLRPGTYRFVVRAANSDGLWNDTGTAISFTVLPHVYQTWWFYAAAVASIAALIFAAYRVRVSQLEAQQRRLNEQVQKALAEIKVLTGLLPICASCKRIRDDGDHWSELETYIHRHSDAEFTHGICPDCMRALYPDDSDAPPPKA